MLKKKIIHIHTDLKFISDSIRFESKFFDNEILVFGKKGKYNGPYKEKAQFYSTSITDINKVIHICQASDMVVLYDLNFIKCYIANRLRENIKIIWRFFGLELYSKIPNYVFSERTLSIKNRQQAVYEQLRNVAGKLFFFTKFKTTSKKELNKGFKRVNYFAGLSDTEYHFLKQYWPILPPFIQLSFFQFPSNNKSLIEKKSQIIVGNNRSAYNNHLDILQLLKNTKSSLHYEFLLLFNYGQNNAYSNAVREMAKSIKEVTIVEDFLPFEDFTNLYFVSSAFVLNGYRQMAMSNVFEALQNNVKIYLNEKNVILDWLRKEGFLIFTINDFASDLETNNLKLSEVDAQINQDQFLKFKVKYNQENFHYRLIKILDDN